MRPLVLVVAVLTAPHLASSFTSAEENPPGCSIPGETGTSCQFKCPHEENSVVIRAQIDSPLLWWRTIEGQLHCQSAEYPSAVGQGVNFHGACSANQADDLLPLREFTMAVEDNTATGTVCTPTDCGAAAPVCVHDALLLACGVGVTEEYLRTYYAIV